MSRSFGLKRTKPRMYKKIKFKAKRNKGWSNNAIDEATSEPKTESSV